MEHECFLPCSQELSPVPVLTQMNPVCVLSFVVTIYVNILHLRLGLRSGIFSLGFLTETFYSFSFSPYVCHMPRPLRTPFVVQPDIIW